MDSPKDVQSRVAEWLAAHGHVAPVVEWRWRADSLQVDLAATMQPFRLTDDEGKELISLLEAEFSGLQAIFFEKGFLNLQFSQSTWTQWTLAWLAHSAQFVAECGLPSDLSDITVYWPYQTLKPLHRARSIASFEGWIDAERLGSPDAPNGYQPLKILLGLGRLLGIKGQMEDKRRTLMAIVLAEFLEIWQKPLLLPAEEAASAWRLAWVKLALAAVEVIGAPFKQSLEASIAMFTK